MFAHETMQMVARNDWLTPVFLDRYVLFKPPMLPCLAGVAAKLAGASPFTLRFPVLAAGAAAVALVFLWLWRLRGWFRALAGSALLVSNEIWHSLSRLCMTDVLLGAFDFGALFCLGTDPAMERPLTVVLFSLLTASAILTKSVAGTAPLLTLFLFAALARKDERPSWGGWHAYAA